MIDWTASMQQTFEHYVVDPGTWKDMYKLDTIKSCTINRDSDADTLGSASIDIVDSVGECYVRTYLAVNQKGLKERVSLGTHLVQTPSSSFNGKMRNASIDAYTPLLELKEGQPPIGYFIPKNENIMETAYMVIREKLRAPIIKTNCTDKLYQDFVSNSDDTWLSFASDLIANSNYEFGLDEMGQILFVPKQDTASLQPVWTYTDDNSSILYQDISMEHDIYGIPNVVEVLYSDSNTNMFSRAVNNNENSPLSIANRGREITLRVTNPDTLGNPTQTQLNKYAEQLLRDKSSLEYTITYTHGYCPVRLGDCVRLNYKMAGLTDIKAKVVSQSIKCEPGCPVTETAIFTSRLWG